MIGYDSADFVNAARSILRGNGYIGQGTLFWGPLFSINILLSYLIIGDWFLAGKILTLFCSIIYLIFSFYNLKLIWNEKIALLTVMILSLTSTITLYSSIIANQMIFSALCSIGFYFLLKSNFYSQTENNNKRKDYIQLSISGLFFGLASLTRYDGYVIFISVLAYIFWRSIKTLKLKIACRKSLVFSAVFFLIQTPWYLINLITYKTILYEKNYLNFALYYYQREDLFWTIYSRQFSSYVDVLINFPLISHIEHIFHNIILFLNDIIYFIPFIMVSIFFIPKILKEHKDSTYLNLLIIIPFFISHLISLTKFRFFIVILPFAYSFILMLLFYFIKYLQAKKNTKKIFQSIEENKRLFNICITILIILIFSFQPKNYINVVDLYHRDSNLDNEIDPVFVSRILFPRFNSNDSIMTIHPTYGYYTGLNFIGLQTIPNLTLKERILSKTITSAYYMNLNLSLKDNNEIPEIIPNYLIIDLLVAKKLPEIAYLFNPTIEIPNYLYQIAHNEKAIIYGINAQILELNN
jgi:hypothetical protein